MSTTTIDDQIAEVRRRIDRLQAFAADRRGHGRPAHPPPPRRAAPGGGIRPGRGPRGARPRRREARAAEDEARRRRELGDRRRLRRVDDLRGRRRGRAPQLGQLPRAPAGDGRDEGRAARERAEAAIADVRTERIAVYHRLAQAREDVNGAWHEQRNHVSEARDELERKADELSAKIK